ncbi:MAG: transposase [Novosphingobium lindaniclasticum]|jgi:hypothetical protein|uniref:DUF2274 domain-containing protein n=1 Tax=Novosphingobium lindaniclasticum TaxID=1329895 RepID=UPI002408F739|nr:DUF2274 domain-containing protein [Novosphingobium lindaniclasticum]MDF2638498.1 transposase [Novosphingobium lindaniclasticum]
MAEIKLGVLPDRKPIKLSIHVVPELDEALRDYARIYASTYGRSEPVEILIPAILAAFLESDRAFAKARAGNRNGGKS